MDNRFSIYAAPLQGFTEAPFRHFHAAIYGCQGQADAYFSPFLRIDHGEVRPRDIRDITSPLNSNHQLIPQIIFKDVDEFRTLTDRIKQEGFTNIDINMGCPFTPQVKKGRGAGMIGRSDMFSQVGDMIKRDSDISYSIKMRLGATSPSEWQEIAPILNDIPLHHITIHPRIATQQYGGSLHTESLDKFLAEIHHPIIFNGDILTPADIERVHQSYPTISGIMIGRGLLSRPSLIEEWRTGNELSFEARLPRVIALHDAVYDHYCQQLCGDSQILSKIKPFWDYLIVEIGHKNAKLIKKATKIPSYTAAIDRLRRGVIE